MTGIARTLQEALLTPGEPDGGKREKMYTEAFADTLMSAYGKNIDVVVVPAGFYMPPIIKALRSLKKPHKVLKTIIDAQTDKAACDDLVRRANGFGDMLKDEFRVHIDTTPLVFMLCPLKPIFAGPFGWKVLLCGIAIANDGDRDAKTLAQRLIAN